MQKRIEFSSHLLKWKIIGWTSWCGFSFFLPFCNYSRVKHFMCLHRRRLLSSLRKVFSSYDVSTFQKKRLSDDRMTEVHDVFSSSIASISIYVFCSLSTRFVDTKRARQERPCTFFIDIVVVQTADNAMTRQNSNHFVIWVWYLLRMRTTFHAVWNYYRRRRRQHTHARTCGACEEEDYINHYSGFRNN